MPSSLLALIDDVATVLDDVALLTKVAAKKTAGVVGDDLALNAQQVVGVHADRELPVVLAVARGSALNKAILVPVALAISILAPWGVIPLLMVGGAFLCFEGFEKIVHKLLHRDGQAAAERVALQRTLADPQGDFVALEKDKIKGAVRTDFVLSAEIVAITLGTVATAPFLSQVIVLVGVSIVMTIGVYGLVAAIVKLDDGGLHLSRQPGDGLAARLQRRAGAAILSAAPYLMKGLSIAGTAAMFLVGGGILTHGIPAAHRQVEAWAHAVAEVPGAAPVLGAVASILFGALAGALSLAVVTLVRRVFPRGDRKERAASGKA